MLPTISTLVLSSRTDLFGQMKCLRWSAVWINHWILFNAPDDCRRTLSDLPDLPRWGWTRWWPSGPAPSRSGWPLTRQVILSSPVQWPMWVKHKGFFRIFQCSPIKVRSGTWMMTGNGVMHNGTTTVDDYGQNLDKLKVKMIDNLIRNYNGQQENLSSR